MMNKKLPSEKMPNFSMNKQALKVRNELKSRHWEHNRQYRLQKGKEEAERMYNSIEAAQIEVDFNDDPIFHTEYEEPDGYEEPVEDEISPYESCPNSGCSGYIKEYFNPHGYLYLCIKSRCLYLFSKLRLDIPSLVNWISEVYQIHASYCQLNMKIENNGNICAVCESCGILQEFNP